MREGKEEGPNKTRQIVHSSPAVCVRISYRASLKQQAIFSHQMWKGKSRTMRSLLLSLSVCVHVQQGQKYFYVCASSAIICFEVSVHKRREAFLLRFCTPCTCRNARKIPVYEGLHCKNKTQRPISAPVHKTCNFIHDIFIWCRPRLFTLTRDREREEEVCCPMIHFSRQPPGEGATFANEFRQTFQHMGRNKSFRW